MRSIILLLAFGLASPWAMAQKTKRFSLISGGNVSYAAFQNAIIAQKWALPNGANGNVYGAPSGTFNPILNYQFSFRYHAWASRRWGLVLGLGQRSQGVAWQGENPERWGHYYSDVLARWSFAPGWYALAGARTDWMNYEVGTRRDGFLAGFMTHRLKRPPLWQGMLAVGRDFRLLRRDFYLEVEYAHDFANISRQLGPDAFFIDLDGPPSLKRRAWAFGLGWRF
jgi:hypothetical protein